MSGSVGLPGGDLALARLPERDGGVQRLLDGLEDHLLLQAKQRADPSRRGGAEMRDVVDAVLMQANRTHQVDMQLVAGGSPAQEVATGPAHGLRHRKDWRDVVAGVRVVRCQEGVVHVEFTHRGAVRPGRPFGADGGTRRHAEHRRAAGLLGMPQRHAAGGDDGAAIDRGDGDRGVVDHPVDDHRRHVLLDRHPVGGHAGHLPGQLVLALEQRAGWVDLDVVHDHGAVPRIVTQSCSGAAHGLEVLHAAA